MQPENWRLIVEIIVGVFAVAAFLKPQPALHKQFADRENTDKLLDQIFSELKELNKSHSDSRRLMYKRINAHSNALHFLAGRLSGKGDPDAIRLREILKHAEELDHDL